MNILEIFAEYYIYLSAFFVAYVIANIFTPVSKRIAFRLGALDRPKARGVHKKTMPLAGGLAIYMGFVITVLLFLPLIDPSQWIPLFGLLLGSALITIIGLLDDIHDIRPIIRVGFQIMAAIIVVATGTVMTEISIPFLDNFKIEFGVFSNFITIVWIIGITNAVNLMDGLDGLAAGISSIASIILLIIAMLFGDPLLAGFTIILTAALAGSCMGFLPYNFNPAQIFMGDTGSTFLGFSLAVISIQTMLKTYTALTLIGAVLILALPIFDTFLAILRRLIRRKPISEGDKEHVHHKLMERGLSQRSTVLTLYFFSGIFGVMTIFITLKDFLLAILMACLIPVLWIIDDFYLKKKRKEKEK